MLDDDSLYNELTPLCAGLGLSLVDCRIQQSKFGHQCQIVVYKEGGTGTEACAKLHRAVYPRLEILLSSQDINLEVSSPGTDRKIRLPREYVVFVGRGLSALLRNGNYAVGVITGSDNESVTLTSKGVVTRVALADIVKAKLDYTQEVR